MKIRCAFDQEYYETYGKEHSEHCYGCQFEQRQERYRTGEETPPTEEEEGYF